eukprot:Colp12_sorted_trinity150504_noHs@18446
MSATASVSFEKSSNTDKETKARKIEKATKTGPAVDIRKTQTRSTAVKVAAVVKSTQSKSPPTKATCAILDCKKAAVQVSYPKPKSIKAASCSKSQVTSKQPFRRTIPLDLETTVEFEQSLFIPTQVDSESTTATVSCIVDKRIYLTGWRGALDEQRVSELGIKGVINANYTEGEEDSSARPFGNKGVKYCCIPLEDNEDANSSAFFESVHKFIADLGGGPVLFHCAAGISRSATFVIAHLMKAHNLTLRDAFRLTKNGRSIIFPNNGFMTQLIEYEKSLMGTATVDIKEYTKWEVMP